MLAGVEVAHFTFSNRWVQFVSHVLPPSGENACSHRALVAVMCDDVNRTLIGLPRNVSSA